MTDQTSDVRTDKDRCRYCCLDLPPVPALTAQHYWQGHCDEPAHQEVVRERYGDNGR
jgi:hypothetical protein